MPEMSSASNGNAGENGYDTTFRTKYSEKVNARALERELIKNISGEVRFDNGSRAVYSTDSSNYRQVPIGVVIPKTEGDIIRTVSICRKYHAPILTRGGGTSLAGQCCNVAVVMDFSKYFNKILSTNKERKLVTIQTGIVLDAMRNATEREMELTFGPDPATHSHCTLGGMLGNNSCGIHSVMAQFEGNGARTSDNVESMTVLTYDGVKMEVGATSEEEFQKIIAEGGRKAEIYHQLKSFIDKYADLIRKKFPNIPRRVSGYNLPELLPENGFNVARALVGSEATLVTILDATLHLLHSPRYRAVVALGYPDVFSAARHVTDILPHKPIGLEGLDDILVKYMRKKGLNTEDIHLLPDGNGWLLVEFGGNSAEEAEAKGRKLMEQLKTLKNSPSAKMYTDSEEQKNLWKVRESGLGATAWVPGEPMSVPGWEDSAVHPDNIGDYLQDLRNLFTKYGYNPSLYGHFGQGCVHCRVQFDLFTKQGIDKYKQFATEAARLVAKYGGSISGEHGDGQARGDLLEIMYGKEIVEAFREFKKIWDPEWKMNPGKIIDSYGLLSNLRISNHYNPENPETHFSFTEDGKNFSQASIRCVGVGECRRAEGGTMCPSYMVTREEEHSTRGRARLLYEMLINETLKDGWKNDAVKNALDLCLSCKGCKGDCPVNVDMASYKAEFLSHYYKGKIRPRSAYAFGMINRWAQFASAMPAVSNFFTQAPGINRLFKAAAGVSQKRKIPVFAKKTFRKNFSRSMSKESAVGKKVIIWADTFNNFFEPEVLQAGAAVLGAAGFNVTIAEKLLCCGRPLYDYGMLHEAKKLLQKILVSLENEIEEGIPIVGMEPSCVAVFRDELPQLFPSNQNARRLSTQVFTLSEFLEKFAPDFQIPSLKRSALVHMHCHHSAVMKTKEEENILERSGMDFTILDSGCCGMAGGFGYESGEHYNVSVAAGERALLPAVRNTDNDTLIIADGFSCRSQIEQQTGRKPIHLAQALQMTLQKQKKIKEDEI